MQNNLKKLLEDRNIFKLVCGAGNEDEEFVKRLVYIYSKAGCKLYDISARTSVLSAAKEGLELAEVNDADFCVSIGIKGDPHISKAKVNNDTCQKCGICAENCLNSAITYPNIIDEKRCIGCGVCAKQCPTNSIVMYEKDKDVTNILPDMIKQGVSMLELHVTGCSESDLEYKWKIICDCKPEFASVCIDRENFGNKEVHGRIKKMIKSRAPYTTIIQADGIPMSGCDDSYKTTLQAVAMAEIVQNAALPVYIFVSGGTNSKTAKLCKLCGIYPNGIAIGSWARKIVMPYILTDNFWDNQPAQKKAVRIAKKLIADNFLFYP